MKISAVILAVVSLALASPIAEPVPVEGDVESRYVDVLAYMQSIGKETDSILVALGRHTVHTELTRVLEQAVATVRTELTKAPEQVVATALTETTKMLAKEVATAITARTRRMWRPRSRASDFTSRLGFL